MNIRAEESRGTSRTTSQLSTRRFRSILYCLHFWFSSFFETGFLSSLGCPGTHAAVDHADL